MKRKFGGWMFTMINKTCKVMGINWCVTLNCPGCLHWSTKVVSLWTLFHFGEIKRELLPGSMWLSGCDLWSLLLGVPGFTFWSVHSKPPSSPRLSIPSSTPWVGSYFPEVIWKLFTKCVNINDLFYYDKKHMT